MQDTSAFYAALSAYAAPAAVAAALVAVWLQNRTAKRLLGFQLFAQVAAQYDSQDMRLVRSRLANTLLADRASQHIDETLLVHFENVGVLVRRKLIDRDLVWNIYSYDVPRYWLALFDYVQAARNVYDPSLYEEFENLAKWLRSKKRSPMGTPLVYREVTADDLLDFLRSEGKRGIEH